VVLPPLLTLPSPPRPGTCYVGSLAGFGLNFFLRILSYVIESEFAAKAGKLVVQMDEDITRASSSVQVGPVPVTSFWRAFLVLVRISLGLEDLDQTSVAALSKAKKSMWLVSLAAGVPPLVAVICVFATSPPIAAGCTGCSANLNSVLAYAVVLVAYICFAYRFVYVAYKRQYPDYGGMRREYFVIAFVVAPMGLVGSTLLIVDPGNVAYDRRFAWEWLLMLNIVLYWVVSVVEQVVSVVIRKNIRKVEKATMKEDPLEALQKFFQDKNEEEKEKFYVFAKR
jgi:hypothetical protein